MPVFSKALLMCLFVLHSGCTVERDIDAGANLEILQKETEFGWSESGAFQSHDRSLIQLLNDFEKPLSFYPVIDLSEGEFRDDDLFYRRGMTTPFSGKAVLYNSEKQILSESIFRHGLPHGPQRTYFSNTIKSSETIYDQGVMSGIHSKWWSNGKLKEEEYWSKGNYFGGKSWDNTGRLIKQVRTR
jgi:hypothetical protein